MGEKARQRSPRAVHGRGRCCVSEGIQHRHPSDRIAVVVIGLTQVGVGVCPATASTRQLEVLYRLWITSLEKGYDPPSAELFHLILGLHPGGLPVLSLRQTEEPEVIVSGLTIVVSDVKVGIEG